MVYSKLQGKKWGLLVGENRDAVLFKLAYFECICRKSTVL